MNTKENIDTGKIQAELCRLVKSHPEETQVKASLFNLIVYTNKTAKTTTCFKDIINEISEQFPCRLIFIQEESNPDSELQVQVVAAAKNSTGNAAGDQIWIEVSPTAIHQVPFLILPHLIPDLPIYLLWGQDPAKDNVILPRLQPLATRIIFDSENTTNIQHFSSMILKTIDNNSSTEIVDMNWIRTDSWRQILGRAFDSEMRINLLHTTTYVKLIYNDLPSSTFSQPEKQAIYLQAWLASCLEWKFDKIEHQDKKTILHYQTPHGPAQIHLVPYTRQDLPAEEIIEIEMSSPDNYNCVFSRTSTQQVAVKASSRYQCLLPFSFFFPTMQSGKSLMQEIFYQRISNHYINMLHLISHIDWR